MNFDLIVAAAGKGTRLGIDTPKPLFEVKGKPILEIILEKFKFPIQKTILVVSKEGREFFEKFVRNLSDKPNFREWNFEIVVQELLNGTVGAVEIGLNKSTENNLFVVWGDHIGISQKLVEKMRLNFENKGDVSMILPTVRRSNPYVNFKRVDNKIVEFQELKNLKIKLDYGENDCGCFLFDKDSLINSIEIFNKKNASKFEEHNFLEVFPYLEQQKNGIYTQVETDLDLTLGINTPTDVNHYKSVKNIMETEDE